MLRQPCSADVPMAMELSTDPYVPATGSLPAEADEAEALAWVQRQRDRHSEGTGFSFIIADKNTDEALGSCGLWLRQLETGRASAGYSIRPSARRRGLAVEALSALTSFGWSIPALHRIELYIEPWNIASIRTAERCGYARKGLLRSHQEIAGGRRDMLIYAAIRP